MAIAIAIAQAFVAVPSPPSPRWSVRDVEAEGGGDGEEEEDEEEGRGGSRGGARVAEVPRHRHSAHDSHLRRHRRRCQASHDGNRDLPFWNGFGVSGSLWACV